MIAGPAEASSVDILIAEDDPLARWALRSLLEQEGYQCAEAGDGQAAIELAQRITPRCALLDLSMPRLDGFGVARALRSDPRTKDIRLHCVTGRVDSAARVEAAKAGFEMYLTKPVAPAQLLRMFPRQLKKPEIRQASGLGLADASALLDEWENQGCTELTVVYLEGEGFAVRGVRPLAASRKLI